MQFREKVTSVVEFYAKRIGKNIIFLSTRAGDYPINDNYGMIILQALLVGKDIVVDGERNYATMYEEKNGLIPAEWRGIKVITGSVDIADFFDNDRDCSYTVEVEGRKVCGTRFITDKKGGVIINSRGP
jgi:hypothetical protein